MQVLVLLEVQRGVGYIMRGPDNPRVDEVIMFEDSFFLRLAPRYYRILCHDL